MSVRSLIIGGSLIAHTGLVYALGRIEAKKVSEATSIEVFEKPADKKEPPPPARVEPPPQTERQHQNRAPKAAPTLAADPTPQTNSAPLSDLPDLGLELSGGGGPGGMAVPVGPKGPVAPLGPVKKSLGPVAGPATPRDLCEEPPAKPKLLNLPQPAYTEAARAAGIEGKVRVQLTVDATGKVVDAKVLAGLGHGLDEAALAAAKTATFEAAVRCGKPTSATFTIAMRFSAG